MNFRPANMNDYDKLKVIFTDIVDDLLKSGIHIWDYTYPVCEIENDINSDNLFVLEKGDDIAAVFALVKSVPHPEDIKWAGKEKDALYIFRLGVNVRYRGTGLAKEALKAAARIAHKRGADYLRLLVGDNNPPAIKLYEKCGFKRLEGTYDQPLVSGDILREYGFEISTDGQEEE